MSRGRTFSMNTARICIDERWDTTSGRVYSKLQSAPLAFSGLGEMLLKMNRIFDEYGYPQAFHEMRSFRRKRRRADSRETPQPGLKDGEINRQKGRYCTFDIMLQSRRQAGWQGLLMRPDRSLVVRFNSEIELLAGLSRAIEAMRLTR